jgi:hypothetical protein
MHIDHSPFNARKTTAKPFDWPVHPVSSISDKRNGWKSRWRREDDQKSPSATLSELLFKTYAACPAVT